MKKIWLFIFTTTGIVCLSMIPAIMSQNRAVRVQSGIAQEVVRFHIRANSASVWDQEVKLQVRDAVIAYLRPILNTVGSSSKAEEVLMEQIAEINNIAESILAQEGYRYSVRTFYRREYFPEKSYGDCTFPSGVYKAVVIELGSGEGQNWWCMLYAGLCFIDETSAAVCEESRETLEDSLTEEEYVWITEPRQRKIAFRWGWMQNLTDTVLNFLNS